ncbi:MAG TPA: hypothetical protein PLJ21_04985 [Pseudobdellovibrionaceae bacterium]|nr:hypothetical protein [Pseudobdellovibrionaceae bacterium]
MVFFRRSFFILIITLASLFFLNFSYALTGERNIQFEWEPIEGSIEYDIELRPRAESKEKKSTNSTQEYNLKSATTSWEGYLAPGYYWLRIRSKDERRVPGPWSDRIEFNVLLETPEILSPKNDSVVESDETEEAEVQFEWKGIAKADEYQFQLQSVDGKVQVAEKLKEAEKKIKLPVAKQYKWSVRANSLEGLPSEESTSSTFVVEGPILENPVIEKPESEFVRILKWSLPEYTDQFSVQVDRYDSVKKKWISILNRKDQKEALLDFEKTWSGGRYRLTVQGLAENRKPSKMSRITFKVKEGDRPEESQILSEKRDSIERKDGWYFLASYLVTQMYMSSGSRLGNDTSIITQEPLGGTGRLGFGWQSKKTPWGFFGWTDLSGFFFNNRTITFGSFEVNSSYRIKSGTLGEFRLQSGLYMQDLPQVRITSITNTDVNSDFSSVSVGGLHLGGEYWHSLSAKLGLQLNMHLYYGFLNMGISQLNSMTASLNPQFGLMGSYKLSPNWIGLMGYTYRKNEIFFTGTDGSENETRLTGHYLSFYSEYYF